MHLIKKSLKHSPKQHWFHSWHGPGHGINSIEQKSSIQDFDGRNDTGLTIVSYLDTHDAFMGSRLFHVNIRWYWK